MRLSTRATYGLRICFMLAVADAPLSAARLAERTDVETKYLEQLLGMLKRGGIVKSYRGKTGGYELTRPPREITVLDMLDALDDGFVPPECVNGDCDDVYCPNRSVVSKINAEITKLFSSMTLYDMVADCRSGCAGK